MPHPHNPDARRLQIKKNSPPTVSLAPAREIGQVRPMTAQTWQRRGEFPILDQTVHGHPLVYLDNAATSQKPRAVLDAIRRYYEEDNANVHRGVHTLSERATASYEAARARAAAFFDASPGEIIFTRGTTEGINLVAQSWGSLVLRPGDRILLTEMEHHSNLVPWQMLATRTGAHIEYLPVRPEDGQLDLSRLDELLAPPTKIFAFTHISNTLGTINPVAQLCKAARERGVITLVDAAQSAGHRPVSVREIGCDFLACSGHKMCAPMGIGVLFGRAECLEAMPPWQGGGEMISKVTYEGSRWNTPPHKFEAGTPNVEGAVAFHAALDFLDSIGRDLIAHHDLELSRRTLDALALLPGIRILGSLPPAEHAGAVSFAVEGVHAHDVVTFMDQRGVALRGGHHCNQPLMKKLGLAATTRASFYFYNTPEEIDRFAEALSETLSFFRGTSL